MTRMDEHNPRIEIPALKKSLKTGFRVEGQKIVLRCVRLADANRRYCAWLNDPVVNRQTESRYVKTTLCDLKKYVGAASKSPGNFFFAIIEKKTGRHVGNIKIDSIVTPWWDHRLGEVGLIIGEKSCWGKGYATEAIRLVMRFAFERAGLHKLTAQCYATNLGSAKAFLRAGFIQEGVRRSHVFFHGKYVDLLLFGVMNPRFKQ